MNEVIKKLVDQSQRPVITADGRYLGDTLDVEKLVKLVVNEVIEVSLHIEGINTIKEHFGIL